MMLNNLPLPNVFNIPKNWIYRGEGNCNIVISLPTEKKVLRIRKIDKPKSIFDWLLILINDILHWCYGKGFKEECRDLNFYLKVMRPLIGYEYTSDAFQIILTRKQVQIFKDGLSKIRPDFRQNKTLQYGRATLFNDFAFLLSEYENLEANTYSIEIKPKQGRRPLNEQNFPECCFCMNQFLKMERKQIKNRTKYCPEDLFSGDINRMKKALKYLYEIPQNNFKIFRNGLVCYDDRENQNGYGLLREMFQSQDPEEMLSEELSDFLQKCLVANFSSTDKKINCLKCMNNNNRQELPTNSVLGSILSVQMLDVEGSYCTYKKLIQSTHMIKRDEWNFIDQLLTVIDKSGHNNDNHCNKCNILDALKIETDIKVNGNIGKDLLLFVSYLLSAVAKDCSFMITFKKVKQDARLNQEIERNVINTKYGSYVVNIGVFDLFPKPFSTIQKHYKRNMEILKVFKKGS